MSLVVEQAGAVATADLPPRFGSRPPARLGLAALASSGTVGRDAWEEGFGRVVRELGLGIPIPPLDAPTRRDVAPRAAGIDVELATTWKNNVLAPVESMANLVANRSGRPRHIELVASSALGRRTILMPYPTVVEPGQAFRFPPQGEIKVRDGLGMEQIAVFAGDSPFPPGVLLRGVDVADRVVHRFEFVGRRSGAIDPDRLRRRTIEIETR